jgi:hypothetical protein
LVKNYLSEFISDLTPKTNSNDEIGRKPGSYNWYEIQDNTAYYQLFEGEKIIWALTSDKWGFALDSKNHYLTSGGFLLVSNIVPLKYLLGILNSKLMKFYFSYIGVFTAGGAYTLKKSTIEEFPIKTKEPYTTKIFEIVTDVINRKESDSLADTINLEKEIDQLVYQLYDLTEEEIEIIENSTQ